MDVVKKTAFEWLEDPRIQTDPTREVQIADPDGWRRPDGVIMNDPITWDNFLGRFTQSTLLADRK